MHNEFRIIMTLTQIRLNIRLGVEVNIKTSKADYQTSCKQDFCRRTSATVSTTY